MKKIILAVLLLVSAVSSFAGTDPVQELRKLLDARATNFAAYKGASTGYDSLQKGNTYAGTITMNASSHYLLEPAGTAKDRAYIIYYDMNNTDDMLASLGAVEPLMAELNAMVRSGEYTGFDKTTDDGISITEIDDKAGNVVLRYSSNTAFQMLTVFGTHRAQ